MRSQASNPLLAQFLAIAGKCAAMKKVYVVDDEFEVLLSLSRWFMSKGCYVRTFSQSKSLFDAMYEAMPDVVVMDMHLKREDGMELCRQIKSKFPVQVPVVMYSASSQSVKEVKDSQADYLIQESAIRERITPLLLSSFASSYEAAMNN